MDGKFKLVSDYRPTGDQPDAIRTLLDGLRNAQRFQTLEGVTGSGKTFTVANVIQQWGRPTLVVSHNKTLAAQLYAELKGFFPRSAVEYFVSYYDYYQPEAYLPATDTFIEKDSSINEEIERLRLAATDALTNRADVIIVASVSCIYGLGSPEDYRDMLVRLQVGGELDRESVMTKLVDIQYTRNDYEPAPGTFRARGDTLDIFPSYRKDGLRVDFFGNRIERLHTFDPTSGKAVETLDHVTISPAKHFVMSAHKIERALGGIRRELEERALWFTGQEKLIEAQRIRMRTNYDLEMMKELGYCGGIENYSRHLSGRAAGARPACLLDFFPKDFLTIVDESHVTVPQLRAMYNGDQARKQVLVDHGFRLPSALDNRPMNFAEFLSVSGPILFTTATPGPFEREVGGAPVPQVIRPTGLVDPPVVVRPLGTQIDDLMEEIRRRAAKHERTLVTTLTKKTAEDLSTYLQNAGLRVKYLHSDIDTLERVEILRGLRQATFDCLVGINLLREGLDLPEVSLVAILDADKEGFLRSETALIQTAGRAARHLHGTVIMYADKMTDSMRGMMEKCRLRREIQTAYNKKHHITPRSIQKSIQESMKTIEEAAEIEESVVRETGADYNVTEVLAELEKEMIEASAALEFERAALLRDQIHELQVAQQPPPAGGDKAKKGARRKGGRGQPASATGRLPAAKTTGRKKAKASARA
ncbi:MAG: excinuclease ABC subunit UvrB [Kiritimatiellaeota bacterium]|nr:excinuclease ABC subunit UvrB [Kiritimatiellota bacterium]